MIPFSPPRIDQKTIDEVEQVLLSGWITTGPKTKDFEKRITSYCGNKTTVCVSSATSGMEVILHWWGIGPGDEVILPAYTYCATINVVIHAGATPVLVDCKEGEFNLDVEQVEKLITPQTKAIIPVDISGYPCDYSELYKVVNKASIRKKFLPKNELQEKLGRILILSDAAHSFGAHYKKKVSGSLADASVFSFHAVKNLTTAEGGAICLNLPDDFDHESIYKELCVKILHGQSKDALAKTKAGGWKYDVIEPGFKCNMTDIQAAIGLVELDRYEETLNRRKEIFKAYNNAFKKEKWFIYPPFENEQKKSSYHLYLLRIKGIDEKTRDKIINEITKEGISVNVHFQPLPLLTAYKKRGFKMTDYPNAYKQYAHEISLPVYYDLTDGQVNIVCEAVKKAIDKCI